MSAVFKRSWPDCRHSTISKVHEDFVHKWQIVLPFVKGISKTLKRTFISYDIMIERSVIYEQSLHVLLKSWECRGLAEPCSQVSSFQKKHVMINVFGSISLDRLRLSISPIASAQVNKICTIFRAAQSHFVFFPCQWFFKVTGPLGQ